MSLTNEYEKLLDILGRDKHNSNESYNKKEYQKPKEESSNKKDSLQIDDYKDLVFDTHSDLTCNPDKLKYLFKQKLINKHNKIRNYERPNLSVTEIFYCLRKVYYERKKYSVDVNKKFSFSFLYLIQEVGNKVHDLISNIYDFDEVEKVVIDKKYGVKGRVDAIKDNVVIELKTIDPEKIQKNNFYIDHYNQGIIYSYILNNDYGYNIKFIEIVYILRTLKDVIVKRFEVDFNKAENFLTNASYLHKKLRESKIPDPINATKEECKFCEFKKYCIKDDSSIKRPFDKEIKKDKDDATSFLLGG